MVVAAPMVGCDNKGSGAVDAGQGIDAVVLVPAAADAATGDGAVVMDSVDAGARRDGAPAPAQSDALKRLNAAYSEVLGAEPTFSAVSAEEPWPDCATSVVRKALKPEAARLKAKADAENDVTRATYKSLKYKWDSREGDVTRAVRAGFVLGNPVATSRPVSFPEVGAEVKLSAIEESPIAVELRSALEKQGGIGSVVCNVRDIVVSARSASGVISAAVKAGAGSTREGEKVYSILCEGPFVVEVQERTAWATLAVADGKTRVTGYKLETDRAWDAALKTKVFQLGRGSRIKVSGVKRAERRDISRYDSPFSSELLAIGYRAEPVWVLGFEPACAHEGLGCTFDDGLPAPSIALEGASCAAPLLAQKDAWLAAVDTGNAGAATEPMLSMLNVLTGGAPDVRKRLADQLLKSKRYPELVALLVEQKDAAGLQALADAQQKADQPRTVVLAYEGLRKLKGDDADVLLQLGAAYLETQSKPRALETLHLAAALKASDAAYQKQVGLLLGVAGDKVGANSALFKACSAGDAEACKQAK